MYLAGNVSRCASLLVLLLVCLALAPSGGALAAASTRSETYVMLANPPGDRQTVFLDPSTATITVESPDGAEVDVHVFQRNSDNFYFLKFAAPDGGRLATGNYDHVEGIPNEDPGRAGMVVEGGTGCDGGARSFHVHDVKWDQNHVTSLWVTFDQTCLNGTIGEIKYKAPGDGAVAVSPGEIWWRDTETDSPLLTSPIVVWNPGSDPVRLGSASISGQDAADDAIASDGCSGRSLAPGVRCELTVKYKPLAVGNSDARVHVPESNGTDHSVDLHGAVTDTRTEVTVLAGSRNYDFTPQNASIPVNLSELPGNVQRLEVWFGNSNANFRADFLPVGSADFASGMNYSGPTGAGNTPLDVEQTSGGQAGCGGTGSYSVADFALAWGTVQRLAIQFSENCSGQGTPVQGTIVYQENDLSVTTSGRKLIVSGQVAPKPTGKIVTVSVERKASGRFVHVVTKRLKLSRRNIYVTRLARPKSRICRATAVLPLRVPHLPRRLVKTFHC